jgi:hypothetical protein
MDERLVLAVCFGFLLTGSAILFAIGEDDIADAAATIAWAVLLAVALFNVFSSRFPVSGQGEEPIPETGPGDVVDDVSSMSMLSNRSSRQRSARSLVQRTLRRSLGNRKAAKKARDAAGRHQERGKHE